MAITKPTDNPDWAESAAASDVNDPALKRPGGFVANDPLPSDWHNYLHRAAGRFAQFAAGAFGADNSKLTLSAENGSIDMVADPVNTAAGLYHRFKHIATGTGVASLFESDVLSAFTGNLFFADRGWIQQTIGTVLDFDLKDIDSILKTVFRADAFTPKLLTLPTGSAPTDTLIRANLVKVAGSVLLTGTPASPTITLASTSHNISAVIYQSTGRYRFQFATPIDTHGDFATHVGRSVVVTLGTDGGSAPDSVFVGVGPLLAGEVDVWVSNSAGSSVDLSTNSVLNLVVL